MNIFKDTMSEMTYEQVKKPGGNGSETDGGAD